MSITPTMASRIATFQSYPLTLLSWNISNAQPSFAAPNSTRRFKEAPRLIRDECLVSSPLSTSSSSSLSPSLPDIIALQECPHSLFGHEVFGPSGYVSMGTQHSHCGYVDLLIRKDLAMSSSISGNGGGAQPIELPIKQSHLPSVAATLLLPNETKLAVSSSHLAPFKEGAYERMMQYTTLMDVLNQESDNCILLGDFNMRAAEDKNVEDACGGGWIDAWKGTGSNTNVKFTWDSFVNRYHEGGFKFKCRFDRCYVRGEDFTLRSFGFIGNNQVEKKGDYLSDHFGMKVGLDVAASNSQE